MAFVFAVIFGLAIFLCLGLFCTAFYALVFPNKVYSFGKNKNRFSLFLGYLVSGFIMFVIIGSTASNMDDPKERIAQATQNMEDQRKAIVRIGYREIRSNVENMTEIQFKDYASSIEGKILDDMFYISDVEQKIFGGYSVSLDYDNPKSISVPEIEFDADKSFAMSLKKSQRIKCNGMIESVTAVMGMAMVDLEDVRCTK